MNESTESAKSGSKRILVVDDTPSVADLIREMLLSFGHKADICGSAKEAQVLFEVGKYDLVITDYTMPGTNGIDFAHALRRRSPEQLIMLITGSTFSVPDSTMQALPVNSILQKPFSVMEFQDVLAAALIPKPAAAPTNTFIPPSHEQGNQTSSDHQRRAQSSL